MQRTPVAVAVVAALVAGAGALSMTRSAAPEAAAQGLVPYDDCAALLEHHRSTAVEAATPWGVGGGGMAVLEEGAPVAAGADAGTGSTSAALDAGAGAPVARGGTGTNLQEQGVDEPDRAKLRDGRLVVLAQQRLTVFTAAATPTVVSSFPLGPDEHGGELLLVGDRALVVTQRWEQSQGVSARSSTAWLPGRAKTRLLLFDLARPEEPELLEESVHDGAYLSARLVGATVRLVTSSTPQVRASSPRAPGKAAEQAALEANRAAARALTLDDVLPQAVRRTGTGRTLAAGPAVDCGKVTHPAHGEGSSTLLVTTLRPERDLEPTDRTAVTAHGDLVYASSDRLYVATSRWGTTAPVPVDDRPGRTADEQSEVTTELHAFDTTDPGRTRYVGTGEVDGYVMGRWALSEHDGALRVATTLQPPWDSGTATSSSVVVLRERDGQLVERGRVDGLGRTERIQAVRYFGELAAVVTFRQTDPLYLVDLSDETSPKVLGELKVPGFSTYLHPLGDGLLLGVGQDATDDGRVTGMQLSVFDVRDLARPRQVDRLPLGPGWSPALDDSRAFGYDPDTRLATLPFTTYGAGFTSSALGVRVGQDGTLTEAGRMEVLASPPDRVLSDGDRVYAVSGTGIVAGDAATMTRTGAAQVPRG